LSQRRKFTRDFKLKVARRILAGESVSAIHQETGIKRSVLYRWRDAYQKEGETGLRPVGRPAASMRSTRRTSSTSEDLAKRIAQLERKIGQQDLEIDFLTKALKRVRQDQQQKTKLET